MTTCFRIPGADRTRLGGLCALLLCLLSGCSSTHHVRLARAGAPTLNGDYPERSAGANPNAPYLVADHTARLQTRASIVDINAAVPCETANLSLYESGAHVDGDRRSVRLNLVNHSAAPCRMGGYPPISLLREDGSLLGEVVLEKVHSRTLEAAFHAGSAQKAAEPSAAVLLPPAGEASFEVGWTTSHDGQPCPAVGALAVSAPGGTEVFTIRHTLTLCEGKILVTALTDGGDL